MIEIVGMGLTEIFIIISIILVLVDILFASDAPTFLAYILLSFAAAINIDAPLLYKVLFGIIILFGLVILHFVIWAKLIEKIHDKFIAPRKHNGGIHGLINKEGIVKVIEEKYFVSIDDELYPLTNQNFKKNIKVKVKSIENNKPTFININ